MGCQGAKLRISEESADKCNGPTLSVPRRVINEGIASRDCKAFVDTESQRHKNDDAESDSRKQEPDEKDRQTIETPGRVNENKAKHRRQFMPRL